jgi:uncharacterized protein YbjT (DUF2867 family)
MATTVLVLGAGGFIGGHIVVRLLSAGVPVTCCGRDIKRLHLKFPGVPAVAGDLAGDGEEDWRRKLDGFEVVINAAGLIRGAMRAVHVEGPARLFQGCRAAGVRRVVHISAIGADRAETEYQRSKQEAEDALLAVPGIEACVVRPSLVIGRGGSSTALFAALAALPARARLGGGLVQPIGVDDLAEAVLRLVTSPEPPRRLDAVGPERMSVDCLIGQIGRWLGLPRQWALPIPTMALEAVAGLGDLFGAGAVSRASLAMLRQGNTGDTGPLAALLGRPPLPIAQALALNPAAQADRWQARLYLLRPVLRLSLAFLWLATAALSFGLYPLDDSRRLLAEAGLTGPPAEAALFGGAALDGLLGGLLLAAWCPVAVGAAQLLAMLAFTLIATALPAEYWLHPFAPLLKNLPIAAATLAMMALEV